MTARATIILAAAFAIGAAAQGTGFDSTRAFGHLREQVALGPRPAGSPANQKNRDYIITVLAASGIKAVEPLLGLSSMLVGAGIVLFAVVAWKATAGVPRDLPAGAAAAHA